MSRVLCISHSSLNGGAEKAFFEMVKAISNAGYDVFCLFPSSGPLIGDCQPYIKSYSIIQIPWWFGFKLSLAGRIKLIIKILISAFKIREHIHSTKPHHVIVNTIAIPGAAIAAKLTGTRLLWFLHETANDGFSLIFGERFSKRFIGHISDIVICNSRYILTHYSSYIKKVKLFLAYQSCDIDYQVTDKDGSYLTFGVVGRISEQKGQINAIKAMLNMPDNVRLFLIGPDMNQYANQLKEFVYDHKLSEKVIFSGETDHVERMYAQLDVIVACGRNEAFGRSVIEAMKCGLPVVVPDKFGYIELVDDYKTGLLYQFDNADDLAEKMTLLFNKDLRYELGRNAKEWASERFNSQSFSESLDKVLTIKG